MTLSHFGARARISFRGTSISESEAPSEIRAFDFFSRDFCISLRFGVVGGSTAVLRDGVIAEPRGRKRATERSKGKILVGTRGGPPTAPSRLR